MEKFTLSPDFVKTIREYDNCKNLTDLQIGLIAIFLRAINTPHYRCGINFKGIVARHNFVIFTWSYRGELSTFDYRDLTQIVFYAHQYSVRIGISAVANGYFKVSLCKAEPFDMDKQIMAARRPYYHPSLEQALESQHQTQFLQDQSKYRNKRGVIWA